jgi:hypothetical protein
MSATGVALEAEENLRPTTFDALTNVAGLITHERLRAINSEVAPVDVLVDQPTKKLDSIA